MIMCSGLRRDLMLVYIPDGLEFVCSEARARLPRIPKDMTEVYSQVARCRLFPDNRFVSPNISTMGRRGGGWGSVRNVTMGHYRSS